MPRNFITTSLLWAFYFHIVKATYQKEAPIIEPDYDNLLYGNIWRHTIYSPPDTVEVLYAKKHLREMIGTLFPQFLTSEKHLRCISHHVLWYSSTEESPLLLDSYIQHKEGHRYPMSIPVTLGNTFNFVLTAGNNRSSTTHVFTLTESGDHSFYLCSHIFYTTSDPIKTTNWETECSCDCKREKHSSLKVLSMLSLSKSSNLYSERSCVGSEKSKYIHNIDVDRLPTFHKTNNIHKQTNAAKTTGMEQTTAKISVMTYNIWNFNSYEQSSSNDNLYVQRFERMLQILRETQPDIAGFQEVRLQLGSGGKFGPNQAEHLAFALQGYQFVYQPAQVMPDSLHKGRTEEGVAVFSKFPIIHHDFLLLFRNRLNSADQHQRICLHVVIDVPFLGKVHVFNTHLSLSHEAREESVSQIIQFMNENGKDEPALLMGDLNANPEEKAIKVLSGTKDLEDLWDKLHPSSSGFTFNNLDDTLSKRIDYIFMKESHKLTALNMDILSDKTKSMAASDHRPVIATLGFKT